MLNPIRTPEVNLFFNEDYAKLNVATFDPTSALQSASNAMKSDVFKVTALRALSSVRLRGRPSLQKFIAEATLAAFRAAPTVITRANQASGVLSIVDSIRDSKVAYDEKKISGERALAQGALGIGAAICGLGSGFTAGNKYYALLWTQHSCALTFMKHTLDKKDDQWNGAACRDIANNSLVLGLSSIPSSSKITIPSTLLNTLITLSDSGSVNAVAKFFKENKSKSELVSLEEVSASNIIEKIEDLFKSNIPTNSKLSASMIDF